VFFLVGALLRLVFIDVQGLSHDELSAWNRLGNYNFSQIIQEGVLPDMHPAFMQVLLQYWTNIFGDSEWSLRIPGTMMGLAAILLIYHLGFQYFNANVALFSSALMLFPILPIIHTTLARPYAPGLFFIVVLLWGIFKLEDSRVMKTYFASSLLIILGAAGAIYTHYYAGLMAGCIGLAALFYVKVTRWLYLFVSGIVAALLFLPHWDITKAHLIRGGLGWLGKPEWYWFWDYLKLYFGNNYWFAGAFLLLLPLGLVYTKFKADNKARFLLLTFTGLYLVSHLISLSYTPILREPGIVMLMPVLLLGLGSFFRWMRPRFFNLSITFLSCFLLGNTLFTSRLFEPIHFEPFREITELIKEYDDKLGSKNVLKLCNVTNINYLAYYARKNGANLNFEMSLIEEVDDIHTLAKIIENSNKDYVMLARTNRAQNVIQLEIIQNRYPEEVFSKYFFYANFNVWRRGDSANRRFIKEINSNNNGELFKTWNTDSMNNEFVGDLSIPVSMIRTSNSYLLIRAKGWCDVNTESLHFVVVAERNGEMLVHNKQPVLYQAWDQMAISSERGNRDFYTAVEIPNKLRDSDELHIYFWNPTLAPIKIDKPKIYVVPYGN
jgi:hypothetical protein